MNRSHLKAGVLTGSLLSAWLYASSISAQVVPDTTLPTGERSQVTGNPTVQIDGGARRGGNLFHSFSQFSIPTGGSAYFNNAADVQNIFSRVTGGSVSNIDGVIRANGTANLFLLNPNGILFGPNASLNLGGSFVATTANSINFADGFQYSAINPQVAPLLTVSVPIGLQLGQNPGAIAVKGSGYNLSVTTPFITSLIRGNASTGLKVQTGQTLALIGGDIDIQGGVLTAEQGRIELGSARSGEVSLRDGFVFSYPHVQSFGGIRLSRQALADASGGGSIQIQGDQVSLADGSMLLIQNQGTQAGGSIRVNAAGSLELSDARDARLYGGLISVTVGVGSGADIAISTRQLAARDGAAISAGSSGPGRTGDVTVQASGLVQLIGFLSTNPSIITAINTLSVGAGEAGDVSVSAREITLLDGGEIGSPTLGTGHGGNITVNASDLIQAIGQSRNLITPSGLTATANGFGDAGQIIVNTSRLVLQDGGAVSTATVGTGRAGSLTINAKESVEISGRPPARGSAGGVRSSGVTIASNKALGLPDRPSGNSGNVTINTPRLSVTNGATVSVSNDGTGSAGTLRVNANSIVVGNGGAITAATASGAGGNLNLNVRDFLLLRNNSQITTSAGGNGNGGNIRIKAGSIVAVPTENSDISANSVNARGGNVTINASGIFGIQFRPQDTPLSDITATGANSALNGTVQLNINRLDPTSGLVALPTTVVDSSRLIAQGCPANQGNSFVITGRGGLPPTPEQQLDDDAEWRDQRRLVVKQTSDGRGARSQKPDFSVSAQPNGVSPDSKLSTQTNSQGVASQIELKTPAATPYPTPDTPIVEATGWQITSTGELFLVANTPNPTVQNRLNQAVVCQGR